MVRHIVMFKLKGTEERRNRLSNEFREALLRLPEEIPELLKIDVGVNCNPKEKWDVVLTAECKNWNDLSQYANHPLHLNAVSLIKEDIEERACVDYNL